MTGDTTVERARFTALFRATAPRIAGYVRRHVPFDEVDDVLADTYLIAWRRRDRLDHDNPVPWLLVTARNVIANRSRRRSRTEALLPDMGELATAVPRSAVDGAVVDRELALAALGALSAVEREAVLLVAWDGLDHIAAAAVAGCSTRAFTVRLHRARLQLARHLDPNADTAPSAPRPVPTTTFLREHT